ncbi:MAG TPA: O-acetylhomoserine aminocarboxypropyltransferase/cysteine synthase family protein [Plantibacter sp.]|uniref:O-acetylhomoserine aminocarboxypropyltransferase/cysteine synthase family protein n=1 Tax=unclassified Plantibacter TaxID=2624265 RepID=UPI002C90634C|nr:O-acetylhomoserine aminocarboxypropyltransferase/cysteine synthase family protein [Plantibacter sp.]
MNGTPDDVPRLGFTTQQLHAGSTVASAPHARALPIFASAGFTFADFDEAEQRFGPDPDGYSYTRVGNPTVDAVERRLAALEGGVAAILLGSGQAAVNVALLALLQAGDHLLIAPSIYEGSRGLFTDNYSRLGITVSEVVDPLDVASWTAAIRPDTRAIFIESIPNPRNDLADLRLVADVAHAHGIPLVVDNTFATPYLLRPIEHGADIVVHSASKFLAGHGTVLGGVIVDGGTFDWAADTARYRELHTPNAGLGGRSYLEHAGRGAFSAYARNAVAMRFGPTPSPFNAFLINQGIETLSLRVQRQSENALALATWLDGRPEIESVDYSGLPGSPYRALADRYLPRGQGAVFSFTLRGGRPAARTVVDAVELFTRMTNLGDVRSLIIHPSSTTHVQRTPEQLAASGIGEGMLRVSVGIEDVADLIGDLERAFAKLDLYIDTPDTVGARILDREEVAA